jgi:hypothetical protein
MSKAKCPDCGETFPGSNSAGHCAACCRTFIGLTAFDAHRVGDHGVDRRCEIREKHWQDERGYFHYGPRDNRFEKEQS